ncbi:MAG: Hsp20/alpha crystallin family protein [Gemmatimonadota bacterium]
MNDRPRPEDPGRSPEGAPGTPASEAPTDETPAGETSTDDPSRPSGPEPRADEADDDARWNPRSTFADLQSAVSEIVDSAIRNVAPMAGRFPRYDLVELRDAYWILVDLPGVPRSDLEVTTAGEELTLSGTRPRPELPEGAELRRGERSFGRFERTIPLPADVDVAGIAAKLTDGVLRITLPRRGGGEAHRVDVT